MSLKRSNTNLSSSSIEQNNNEAHHYLQKAIKAIKDLTLVEKSYKGLQSEIKIKKLIEINKYLEIASRKDPTCISVLVQHKLLIYIKHFFVQNITKAQALCFLRLLIPSQINSSLYLSHNIPLLVVRVLQRDDNKIKGADWQQQATEALKLIASWLQHLPQNFPRLLGTSLVAFAQLPALTTFQQRKKDHISQHLKLLAIDVILVLTLKNLDLSLQIGAFTLLINSIIDPIVQERSQDILIRIIYFLNEEQTRKKVMPRIDLNKLFTIFTDLDYVFIQQNSKNKGNIQYISKMQNQLLLSKKAFLTLLKSWTGIIILANDEFIISTMFQALKQIPKKQDSQVRKMIYSLLQDILRIGQSLLNSKISSYQNQFQATSLLSSFMIALLRLLMDHQLFKLLIQLSGTDEPYIAQPAQKLLKKLSIYIFNFFPDAANYLDFLITAGTKSGPQSAVLKHSSSFIVSKIGNYVFDDKKQMKTSFLSEIQYIFNIDSIFTPLSRISVIQIAKTLNQIAYKQIPHYRKKLLQMKPIPKQHKQNFKLWDWNAIIDLLSFPDIQKEGSKPDSTDKYNEYKLFKYLLKFYSYSGGTFAELKWTNQNLIYIKTGKLLILNILTIPDNLALVKNPPESQFLVTISFIGDLQKLLQKSLKSCSLNSIKYDSKFFKTLQRQSLLWIGSFSRTKIGYESLLCENHFFQILQEHLHKKQCCYIISSLIFFFDFYRESLIKKKVVQGQQKVFKIGPRALLIKCVKEGSKSLKLMCIELIKYLYMTQLTGFSSQGLKLLLSLVLEDSNELSQNAVQTIQILIRDKSLLESLLTILIEVQMQNKQKFNRIKQKLSSHIFIRLSGLMQGYTFLTQKHEGWLERQYEKWFDPEQSKIYFDHLQSLLNNTLNYNIKKHKGYMIQTQGKDFVQWYFLYKLPWLLYINDGQEVPLLVKLTNQYLILYNEFTDQQYDFRSINSDNIIRICLGLGSMYLDEGLNHTKIKYFNNINLNNNNLVTLYGEEYYCSQMNGISVYFLLKPQGQSIKDLPDVQSYANSYDIKRIHIQIKFSQYFNSQGLPLHLIQQITNTELGMQFLKKKELTVKSKMVLQDTKSSTSQTRTVLWSLGYYGSTKQGINNLIKQGIVQRILQLSKNSPTLSLRGTCRYVLNMFCHSQAGRNYITKNNNFINKKFLSCFPNKFTDICELKSYDYDYQKQNVWQAYQKSLVKLSENQQKIFDNITLFINSLSSKQAIAQIKELLKSTVKLSWSFPLLQNVINLMSYFKMKYQARKTIHFIFDEFVKSNQFVNEINKIDYLY